VNIIEAIKSGKRFRRKSWTTRPWLWLEAQTEEVFNHHLELPVEAITADDWEVEEAEVTINRSILAAVWKRAKERTTYTIEYHGLGSATYIPNVDLEDLVAEELGL